MRSFARRRASHSSALGGNPKRAAARVAPGSMRIPVRPTSTYVAIDRTPRDSAASGMTFMASDAAAAVHFDAGAGDHRRVVGGEEHGGARQVLGLVQTTERHCRDVAGVAFLVHRALAHERRQHRRLGRDRRDRDHPNAVARRLERQALGQGDDGPLRGGVGLHAGLGPMAAVDAVIRNTPRRCFFITGSAYLAPSQTPLTLTAMIRSKRASSTSSTFSGDCGTPAFAKKTSSRPHAATAFSTIIWLSAARVTSARTASA